MRFLPTLCVISLSSCLWTAVRADEDLEDQLDSARSHCQHGRYDEASEIYDQLVENGVSSQKIAIGRADVCLAIGRWDDAEDILSEAVEHFPENSRLAGRLAEVQFRRGKWEEAQKTLTALLKTHPDEPLARLIQARLWTGTGKIGDAEAAYNWFIKYYNRAQPTDAETLLMVAEGALQYTRWKGGKENFNFVLNTLCVDALKNDPNCWQSYLLSGELLLEKYNRAQGVPELQKGLAINPRSAELLAVMGQSSAQDFHWDEAREYATKALAINPRLPGALRLAAEAMLQDDELAEAKSLIDRALAVNAFDQETLALQAVLLLQQDGFPAKDRLQALLKGLKKIDKLKLDKPSPFEQLVIDLAQRNPRPGYFLAKLGSRLEAMRKHELAEAVYLQTIEIMPQLAAPKTELGLLYMQTGKTKEAEKLLDVAFKADPFHVRVSNMRKVLKVLDGYDTISTDHFIIRADTEIDRLLARYMADYLEEIYPELTAQFGYEPPTRTQIEVYNKAKGLTAHQWFSARMIGLPWIQTIGASTGMIIAMASPTGLDEPLNWARVLKHEFVHVITLQQTEFHIPHWYTEALAVRSEGYPRPAEWNRLLLDRVPRGRLRNLDNLNLGFQRAENREDWNFSYCQSSLYAQYMVERFGADATAKLLDSYRRQLSTDDAIPDSFGVTKSEFEQGYRDFLTKLVSGLKVAESEPRMTPAEIMQAYEADSADPNIAGRYAQLMLLRNNADEAKELAASVLEREPKEPHAALVLAALAIQAEDKFGAEKILAAALNPEKPHRRLLEQLASLQIDLEDYPAASKSNNLGREKFPDDPVWWRGTVIAARKLGESEKLKLALETLCELDYDQAAYPLERAELALVENDLKTARSFGIKALHIDVLDVRIHALLGKSQLALGDADRAVAEFRVALELKPGDADLQTGLAECYVALKRTDEAREVISAVLKKQPDHVAAKAVLKTLKP